MLLPFFDGFYAPDAEVACWTGDLEIYADVKRGHSRGPAMALLCLAIMPLPEDAI